MYETTAHTSRFRQELHFNQFLALSHNNNLALSSFQNQTLHVLTFLWHKRLCTNCLTHVLLHVSSVAITACIFLMFFFSLWGNACKLDSFCSNPTLDAKLGNAVKPLLSNHPLGMGKKLLHIGSPEIHRIATLSLLECNDELFTDFLIYLPSTANNRQK